MRKLRERKIKTTKANKYNERQTKLFIQSVKNFSEIH